MPSKRKAATSPSSTQPPNKKPQPQTSAKPAPEIVGGLNGDYRITGTESTSAFRTFTIPTDNDKVIPCQERQPQSTSLSSSTNSNSKSKSKSKSNGRTEPLLIFTHGAGGGLDNPATKYFADGYGTSSHIICFQGTMNLQSRVRSFTTILDELSDQDIVTDTYLKSKTIAVGGRSMGARAAVLCAQNHDEIKKLVLVSYPLKGQKGDIRDEILCDLPSDKEILFLVGSEDSMCPLSELEKVRKKMKAKTWLVSVEGADHGMSVKLTKKGLDKEEKERVVKEVRKRSGQVAAEWVRDSDSVKDGGKIDWVDLEYGDEEAGDKDEEEEQMEKSEGEKTASIKDDDGENNPKRSSRKKK